MEFGSEIRADKETREILEKSGKAEFITNAKLKEIKGDVFVKQIIYEDTAKGEEKTINVSGVFVEIGYRPAISFIAEELVDFTKNNEVVADPRTCETKTPGLFASGDVSGGNCKQIVVAAAEGAKAALSVNKYLKNN